MIYQLWCGDGCWATPFIEAIDDEDAKQQAIEFVERGYAGAEEGVSFVLYRAICNLDIPPKQDDDEEEATI